EPAIVVDLIDAELVLTRQHIDAPAGVEHDRVRGDAIIFLAAHDVVRSARDLDAVALIAQGGAGVVGADAVPPNEVIVRAGVEDDDPRSSGRSGDDVPVTREWPAHDRIGCAIDADPALGVAKSASADRAG